MGRQGLERARYVRMSSGWTRLPRCRSARRRSWCGTGLIPPRRPRSRRMTPPCPPHGRAALAAALDILRQILPPWQRPISATGRSCCSASPARCGTTALCPIRALRRWQDAAGITEEAVFRRIWAPPRGRDGRNTPTTAAVHAVDAHRPAPAAVVSHEPATAIQLREALLPRGRTLL
jgi:hypothetical protein